MRVLQFRGRGREPRSANSAFFLGSPCGRCYSFRDLFAKKKWMNEKDVPAAAEKIGQMNKSPSSGGVSRGAFSFIAIEFRRGTTPQFTSV